MKFSPHATLRRAQRRVSGSHIAVALDWGTPIRQPDGRVAYHLGRRDVARAVAAGVAVPPGAAGVSVIEARDGTVVTVLRSPDRHRLRTFGRRPRACRTRLLRGRR